MARHEILGGLVQVYKRGGKFWHCSASVDGRQHRASTKEEELPQAKQFAEDWYLTLRGKARAGLLKKEKTFGEAADQFEKEYEVITEGQRSARWTEGHKARIRIHLRPFFGKLGLSEVTPGKVQEYRVHRMTVNPEANPPDSKSNRKPKTTPPSRSTLHDEIVTLRLVLKTAIRHGWLAYLPDLSPPYRTQGKIMHRPWFSPEEYIQLYKATRQHAESASARFRWNAEQVHDYVLFMANTGLRPDEARNLQHRDVTVVQDRDTDERILEIEVRGKRGVGFCKSMPGAVYPYQRLLKRAKPVDRSWRGAGLSAADRSRLPGQPHQAVQRRAAPRQSQVRPRRQQAHRLQPSPHLHLHAPDRRRGHLRARQELPHQRRDDPEILCRAHQGSARRIRHQYPAARLRQASKEGSSLKEPPELSAGPDV